MSLGNTVSAILSFLFMVPISLVPVLALLYFYVSTFLSMCAVPNMFRCILGLVALTVSEWSVLSFLDAVTFLSPSSTPFPITPDVSIPGLQE